MSVGGIKSKYNVYAQTQVINVKSVKVMFNTPGFPETNSHFKLKYNTEKLEMYHYVHHTGQF